MLIPKSNERDLKDIPENVKEGLKIQPVETIDEVFKAALVSQPVALKPHQLPVQAGEIALKN